jgi:hypothetical protein
MVTITNPCWRAEPLNTDPRPSGSGCPDSRNGRALFSDAKFDREGCTNPRCMAEPLPNGRGSETPLNAERRPSGSGCRIFRPMRLIPLLAAVLLGQDVRLVREGPYWARTESGSVGVPRTPVLRVSTRGRLTLRGSAGEEIAYRVVERVRARSKNDARRLLGTIAVVASVRHGVTTLRIVPAPSASEVALEIDVPPRLAAVEADTRLGDIEAYDLDCNLRADTTAGQIRCDRIRGGVEGNTGGGEIHLGKIDGPVRCVSAAGSIVVDSVGGEANCHTAGGEIVVHQAGGPLRLSTEGGNIQVDRAASSVEAHTAEGVIEVLQAGGVVLADTRSGSIQIGSARGVRCESAAGAIRVKTSSGPLRISTAMGNILAQLLAGARLDDSSLVAGAGDVTVLIPSNLALSVRARNESGGNPRIVSDFPEVRARSLGFIQPPLVAEGAINGGGPRLRIDASGGTIYLRRLK